MSDNQGGSVQPSGRLGIQIIPAGAGGAVAIDPEGDNHPTLEHEKDAKPDTMTSWQLLRAGLPHRGNLVWGLKNQRHFLPGWFRVMFARRTGVPVLYGSLRVHTILSDGTRKDYGLVGLKLVTTAGVTKIVDFLRNNDATTGLNFKYHALGTGSTAESAADTAMVTELTTEYAVDSTRPTGTQTNNGATVYRTVGTNVLDGTPGGALREHGVFSSAASTTLLDRTVYAAITLSSGDTFVSTYDLTCAAGG